jgi:DNA-binding CsgD family transcriptional regulator
VQPEGHLVNSAAQQGDVFFGRERELAALELLLEQVRTGQGRVVVLAGDIGIGKTRTAQLLAKVAEERHVQVLWGRCYEEPGAPPYWPWLQLIRSFIAAHDDERLRAAIGPGTSPIAEIVPELAARLADVMPTHSTGDSVDAPQARFRLFDAITSFFRRAAAFHPLALIFDNVHWADAPSLRLLEFLSAEIADSPLLLLGTYRDIELSRQHPLSDTLGELARHPWFRRMRLGGLSRAETGSFMTAAAGSEPSQELLSAVYEQTEGNPLFVVEMTRFLVQEGLLGRTLCSTAPTKSRLPLRRIPEGVREVIGSRLNRLSATCNRMLAVAAVIGRNFGHTTLFALLEDVPAEQLNAALEEALQTSIIEERSEPGAYQFSHALIRETLYEELSAPKRVRLHLKLAEALEKRRDGDPMAWLSALAHHYCEALPAGDPAKAIEYARRAAEHAKRLFAYEESARLYRLALQSLEAASGDDAALRLRLFIALGDALIKAGENVKALEILQQAAGSAKALGLAEEFARAARAFEGATWRPGFSGTTAAQLLSDALSGLGEGDTVLRAEVMSSLARALIFSGAGERGMQISEQAVAMARRLGDPSTLACALRSCLSARWQPELIAKRLSHAAEAMALSEELGDKDGVFEAASWRLFDLMEIGDTQALAREFAGYMRDADALGQPFYQYVAALSRATFALFHGEFTACEQYAEQALERGRRMPSIDVAGIYGVQMFSLRREQGRLKEVAPLVTRFVRTTPKAATWRPGLAIIYTELGLRDEARAEFDVLSADGFARLQRDAFWITCLTYLAEVCAFLEDAAKAAELYGLLAPFSGRNVLASPNVACYGAADRYLGLLATTLRRWSDAERHYEAALELNLRQEAWPWFSHTQYDYAAMLLARDSREERDRAVALLAQALERARVLGMAGLAERAERLLQRSSSTQERESYPAGLSRREIEVLRLVASGKGNREIAKLLFVSPNTVANHIRSILTKTNTANRTEAAAFAIRHGLAQA